MSEPKRKYYFRCQYQADTLTISEVAEEDQYISIVKMMLTLCLLVRKVSQQVDQKTGGRVALAVVNKFKDMVKNMEQDTNGNGGSKSYMLDPKSKHKANRSERLDVEFYGVGGKDDGKIADASKFLQYFKQLVLNKPKGTKKEKKVKKDTLRKNK